MGAMIFCNLCKKELFQLDPDNPKTITGEEICETCGRRVEAAFSLLENLTKEFQADLAKCLDQAKREYGSIEQIYASIRTEGEDRHAQMLKELENLRDNVIKQGAVREEEQGV